MMTKVYKPFNLNEAINGSTIETRSGKKVKDCYFFDKTNSKYPLIVVVEEDGFDDIKHYSKDGRYWSHESPSDYDLVMVDEYESGIDYFHDAVNDMLAGRRPMTSNEVAKIWIESKVIDDSK